MQEQFENLKVWQKAMDLVTRVYQFTNQFPQTEQYGLTSQMRRAAVSIPANIAEGKGRSYQKERIQFFHMARGSAYELITLIRVSENLKYLKKDQSKPLLDSCSEITAMLNGLIQSIR